MKANRSGPQDWTSDWRGLGHQAASLLEGERDPVANAANLSALLFAAVPGINWVGFYFLRGDELVVGPFQGQPACVRIPLGKGVCGVAAITREAIRVSDVLEFDGHIACDPLSRSELVVPLQRGETLLGVLDIDSPHVGRFSPADEDGVRALAEIYCASLGD